MALPRCSSPARCTRPGRVVFGIRPENICLAAPGAPGLAAPVRLRETLGADTLVWLDFGGQRISMRMDPARARPLA
ncbi:TOBE domain-containing protein [Pseudogemmobacter sonorensis]|uniref:TOBE domain-containing protein n=1 Tax=Pseudogemmobacter sonorensis TaxID=2989681 RepID=UPI0036927B95